VKHLKPINQKAARIEAYVAYEAGRAGHAGDDRDSVSAGAPAPGADADRDVVGLRTPPHEQDGQPHFPLGCSLVFAPGWEVDSQGGTAGLCQPVERDIFDCHLSCFWPAHVPDQLNHSADWTGQCASAQKDWRKLDLIFP
jgi:hypothetical protein